MKFSELNPQLSPSSIGDIPVEELRYTCPTCKRHVIVMVRRDVLPSTALRCWNLKHSELGWDGMTIEPSIQDHPHSRREPPCAAHITVTNGLVEFH